MLIEVLCLLMATSYFLIAPRIYEANFSIGLPKVPSASSNNHQTPRMRLMISPQDFIRPTQDPMGYPAVFIKECMGEDSNANRKRFIQALQMGVKQQGDVISFTLRLEGSRHAEACANLLLAKVLNDLTITQENYLKSAGLDLSAENIAKPSLIHHIRMSDSYVKPDFIKLFVTAFLGGIFLAVFWSIMRKRYSA